MGHEMKNHTVSDIFCLTAPPPASSSADPAEPFDIFSIKGSPSVKLRRIRDFSGSDVFPPGCMGNGKAAECSAEAKKREHLSLDEKQRVVNLLKKLHNHRKRESKKLKRTTFRLSPPEPNDLEYLVQMFEGGQLKEIDEGGQYESFCGLGASELKFVKETLKKKETVAFLNEYLENCAPSRIDRNPITGDGITDDAKIVRKRDFDSVLKFLADKS